MKTKIIVHCADTPTSMDIGVREIARWHVEENGWSAIGYNWVIRRSGAIEGGRDLDNDGDFNEETGAHAKGFNTESIGICLVGGKGGFNFTYEQVEALKDLIDDIEDEYGPMEILGHRDLDSHKTCPSFDVKAMFGAV